MKTHQQSLRDRATTRAILDPGRLGQREVRTRSAYPDPACPPPDASPRLRASAREKEVRP